MKNNEEQDGCVVVIHIIPSCCRAACGSSFYATVRCRTSVYYGVECHVALSVAVVLQKGGMYNSGDIKRK
jgi:hypothetical protein